MAHSVAISPKLPHLPAEIITDILSRLPVKSLLCFRCVSKPWCCLIDSQEFMKMHLKQSKSCNSNRGLILGGLALYSVDLDTLECATYLKTPFRGSNVIDSCGGLVLVVGESPILWNPSTRKYKELPATPIECRDDLGVSTHETYGFGFDSKTDDFKVVRVVEFTANGFEWMRSEVKVYSLKLNSWKKVDDFPYALPFRGRWGVHLNGVLHTLVEPFFGSGSRWLIMAFDIGAEKHYAVPKPAALVKNVNIGLAVLEGTLSIVAGYKNSRTEIWIMKEYGDKESWTKLLSIAPPLIDSNISLAPLAYSKCGAKVLMNWDDKWLKWFDIRNRRVEDIPVPGLPFIFHAVVYQESLFSFDEDAGPKKLYREKRKTKSIGSKRDDFLSEGFKLVL